MRKKRAFFASFAGLRCYFTSKKEAGSLPNVVKTARYEKGVLFDIKIYNQV